MQRVPPGTLGGKIGGLGEKRGELCCQGWKRPPQILPFFPRRHTPFHRSLVAGQPITDWSWFCTLSGLGPHRYMLKPRCEAMDGSTSWSCGTPGKSLGRHRPPNGQSRHPLLQLLTAESVNARSKPFLGLARSVRLYGIFSLPVLDCGTILPYNTALCGDSGPRHCGVVQVSCTTHLLQSRFFFTTTLVFSSPPPSPLFDCNASSFVASSNLRLAPLLILCTLVVSCLPSAFSPCSWRGPFLDKTDPQF